MPSKTFKYTLDGDPLTIQVEFNILQGWERVTINEKVIFDGYPWFQNRHPFQIGKRKGVVALVRSNLSYQCELTIDGQPFEMLPEQSYLRAASSPESEQASELLRAANNPGTTPPDELLRPSQDNNETA